MSISRAQEEFFPYLYADAALRLSLAECKIDGKRVNVDWNDQTSECDLTSFNSWSSAHLKFTIATTGSIALADLVPSSERRHLPTQLVGTMHCQKTYKRQRISGAFDSKLGTGTLDWDIDRSDVLDSADLRVYAVRSISQSIDNQYASDIGARLMTSQVVTLRFDQPGKRPGPGLNIEWESFSKSQHKYRAANPQALFHLDTDGPVLYLNKDCDRDLQAILAEEAPKGRKATLRNFIFSSIAMPVWNTLVRTALHEVNDDGSIEPGWQRNVLVQFARAAEPSCDEDEALRRVLDDLKDKSGGRSIEQRIPVVISGMVQFRERAEQTTRVLV